MSKIVVYTFDGTASGMPNPDGTSVPGAYDYDNPGSYAQKIGKRLQDYNPNIYEWFPVDYTPYLFLTEFKAMITRSDVALDIVTKDILGDPATGKPPRPAGTKFVLSGLSQGTLSVGRLYNEFRYGNLQSRRDDLIGIVNFGDILRPRGWTVPLPNAIDPGGQGVADIPLPQSYGTSPGLIADPEPFYLSFAQPGDSAACANLSGIALEAMNYVVSRVVNGAPGSDSWAPVVTDFQSFLNEMFTEIKALTSFAGVPVLDLVAVVQSVGGILMNWFGFILSTVFNAAQGLFPGFEGLVQVVASGLDPHQQYDLNPNGTRYPYLGVSGNSTKTAVQLGYEWCVENLTPIVDPEPDVIYTGGLAQSSGGNKPKPIFYYAQGTSWLWNWLGFSWSGGSVQILNNTVAVPDIYVFGNVPIFGKPYVPGVHIKGLNGQQIYWEGGIVNDPFPYLLDTELWRWKRVQYPASGFFMGPSIEVGVDWVINDILSTPVGTPFALGGYSQGASVMSRVYNECRNGRLSARRADLRGMVTFGNPMREAGHTFPNSGGYSGACDISGDTRGGHGTSPALEDIDVLSPFVRRFARLQNTEDLVWDFTMPNEVISGVGDSPDGKFLQNFVKDSLRQIPIAALFSIDRAMNQLWNEYGKIPAGIPQGTDPSDSDTFGRAKIIDSLTGDVAGYMPGGGHILYPFYPPPNSDGSIPLTGDTCYQLAAKYINSVGERIYDEQYPSVVSPTTRAAYSWFTSLPTG